MESELSKNLRRHAEWAGHGVIPCQDMRYAADRLDELERENEQLRAIAEKAVEIEPMLRYVGSFDGSSLDLLERKADELHALIDIWEGVSEPVAAALPLGEEDERGC